MIYTKFNSQYGTEFGGFSHWSSVTSNSFIHTCLFTDVWCFIVFFRFLNFSCRVRQLRIIILYWVLVTKNSFLIRKCKTNLKTKLCHVFPELLTKDVLSRHGWCWWMRMWMRWMWRRRPHEPRFGGKHCSVIICAAAGWKTENY